MREFLNKFRARLEFLTDGIFSSVAPPTERWPSLVVY